MTVYAASIGPKPQYELSTGVPMVGGLLYFYVAGSVGTKQNTYTDSTGAVANPNPITLNALGMPPNEIWFTSGQLYKIVLAPAGIPILPPRPYSRSTISAGRAIRPRAFPSGLRYRSRRHMSAQRHLASWVIRHQRSK